MYQGISPFLPYLRNILCSGTLRCGTCILYYSGIHGSFARFSLSPPKFGQRPGQFDLADAGRPNEKKSTWRTVRIPKPRLQAPHRAGLTPSAAFSE